MSDALSRVLAHCVPALSQALVQAAQYEMDAHIAALWMSRHALSVEQLRQMTVAELAAYLDVGIGRADEVPREVMRYLAVQTEGNQP